MGMITNPPPYDNAPTLTATHASASETAGRGNDGGESKRAQMQPEMLITPDGIAIPSR